MEEEDTTTLTIEDVIKRANVDNVAETIEIINESHPMNAFLLGTMLEHCRRTCGRRILVTCVEGGIHLDCYQCD